MFRSPLFAWSPRPDQDQDLEASLRTPATQNPSRFSAFRNNVRGIVNGSSIYSQSPALNNNTNINTPKTPFLGFWNRQQQPNLDADTTHHLLSMHIIPQGPTSAPSHHRKTTRNQPLSTLPVTQQTSHCLEAVTSKMVLQTPRFSNSPMK
ncbi:unnamed protein product [Alternaria alternata]